MRTGQRNTDSNTTLKQVLASSPKIGSTNVALDWALRYAEIKVKHSEEGYRDARNSGDLDQLTSYGKEVRIWEERVDEIKGLIEILEELDID